VGMESTTSDISAARDLVLRVLHDMMDVSLDDAVLASDPPLCAGGLELESLSLTELVAQCEEYCGMRVSDEDFQRIARLTVTEFAAYVASRAAGREPVWPGRV
jgi:acyl carrier protein